MKVLRLAQAHAFLPEKGAEHKKKGANALKREERIKIAEETVAISKRGEYTSESGTKVTFDPKPATQFFSAAQLEALAESAPVTQGSQGPAVQVECVDEGVVDTVFRLRAEGVDMSRVGVLNFASAYHPGGGFLNGSMAQEEAIAYCSNLYLNQVDTPFYEENRKIRSKMYGDHMLFSRTFFFRTSDYRLTDQPVSAGVITSPAVNMGQVITKREDVEKAKQVMKRRMDLVLELMLSQGCTTAVLGAFGCGVFQNDPELIARYWKELLSEKGARFARVIMVVLDKPGKSNYKVFCRYF